ncbi:flagellar basal-body MS-ring/collar protein FliF [Photobacterium leiognathi]|uniref:flagellar basal-body MS-ring/collar protein FliF n=1 Tax=Photobacterium leiognathi TaxID=553611 RepID=UPI0029824CF5|nr:flagellar basal-body MS-ring/collar protein FliF [Photobacterium leiognathi]
MEFNKKGKILLTVGTITIVLITGIFYFLILNKDYEHVFSDLSPEQLSKVATSLEDAGLKFNYPESGDGLLIEKGQLSKARIQLSKDGVFQSEITGLEIFGEAQHAMSDFYQRINYQRALQGELERSIIAISGVEAARVHLAIPREKSFSRKETDVKAAVTLTIDNSINPRSVVYTVKRLVASSVIDLKMDNVSVLDSNGKVLGGNNHIGIGTNEALTLKEEIESSIEQKILKLLSPYYDAIDIGISSWATVNNDRISETSKGLDASEEPIVLKRTTETTQGKKKSVKSTVTNEEFSYKSITRAVDYQKGKLERITVSVMVPTTEDFSHSVLHELLSNALGIDKARGDKLTVAFLPVKEKKDLLEVLPIPNKASIKKNDISLENSNIKSKNLNFAIEEKQYYIAIMVIILLSLIMCFLYFYKRKFILSVTEEKQIIKDVNVWLEGRTVEQDIKL